MEKIIEFRKYPLDMILEKLLADKTTGKQIIWATDGYSEYGRKYCDRYEMTLEALKGINPVLIQPRAFKALETQQQRTMSKAEVFTPTWIVNQMINHLDEEWFGRPEVFNIEESQTWKTNAQKIDFKDRKWKDYVDQTVLEITCGEAPFIVSRYNASTGDIIPIEDRIGVLDRKLRVVTENTDNEEDWLKWTKRAYESVYGYEYQGDNLLIGRINLLMTFLDYYRSVWKKDADKSLLTAITNIIAWNFWQMDGLNGTVPLGVPQPMIEQITLFNDDEEEQEKAPLCKVRKWRAKKTILYKEIETKEGNGMSNRKFDVVIGKRKMASAEFKNLWKQINQKTIYTVNFDSDELVEKSIASLDEHLQVAKVFFRIETGKMDHIEDREQLVTGNAFAKDKARSIKISASASQNVKYDLVGKIVEDTGLTRKTIIRILQGIKPETFNQFKENPEDFIIKASSLINDQKATAIIQHITYDLLDEAYDTDIFTDATIKGQLGKNAMKTQKHLFDHLIFDSDNEKKFASDLDTSDEVAVYVKLPNSFFISTPVGKYNPDWAIAFYEGNVKHIYFVAETKGSMNSLQLREVEKSKIECAREHFKAISGKNVVYDVVDNYQSLMDKVMK